jgi:hypothetical protein
MRPTLSMSRCGRPGRVVTVRGRALQVSGVSPSDCRTWGAALSPPASVVNLEDGGNSLTDTRPFALEDADKLGLDVGLIRLVEPLAEP